MDTRHSKGFGLTSAVFCYLGQVSLRIVAFSQRDRHWAQQKLGSSSLTIGQAGCALVSVAGMLATWGVDIDPRRLNIHLRDSGGYRNSNLLIWAAVERFGVRLTRYINSTTSPAPIDELAADLAEGAAVIALVDFRPGAQISGHWVRLHSVSSHSGHISDPWQLPGRELVGISRYLAKSWDTSRGIFAAAVYRQDTQQRHTELRDVAAIGGLRPKCKRS